MLSPSEVEDLFEERARLKGGLVMRFQDTKSANGSWLKPNPSDFVVAYESGSVYCEVKSFKGKTFPFSNIKSSQFAWAAKIHALQQPYMFYLFQKETETWYLIPAFVILNKAKEGIKSLSLTELEIYRHD